MGLCPVLVASTRRFETCVATSVNATDAMAPDELRHKRDECPLSLASVVLLINSSSDPGSRPLEASVRPDPPQKEAGVNIQHLPSTRVGPHPSIRPRTSPIHQHSLAVDFAQRSPPQCQLHPSLIPPTLTMYDSARPLSTLGQILEEHWAALLSSSPSVVAKVIERVGMRACLIKSAPSPSSARQRQRLVSRSVKPRFRRQGSLHRHSSRCVVRLHRGAELKGAKSCYESSLRVQAF